MAALRNFYATDSILATMMITFSPKSRTVRSLIAVVFGALLLAGCHGTLHHGHVPPGQAKKVIATY